MNRIAVVRRLALAAIVLGLCVVVFGAYVRLTYAGLGCPDWPGCYGHVTPLGAEAAQAGTVDAPLHVGKAWREMIHRYAATTLGLIILAIAVLSLIWRRERNMPRVLPLALVGLVMFQGLLGMLTVTWKVKPLIVTAHLVFGLLTVSVLWWLWLSLGRVGSGAGWRQGAGPSSSTQSLRRPATVFARRAATLGLVALVCQILLGGWTSTNYAAVACADFPMCQQAWWPTADFKDAFVLWRGLGVNYEGGVLDLPARVAIHLTHRLGAIVATLALLFAAWATLRNRIDLGSRGAAWAVIGALGLQLCIGIFMVLRGFPLNLATAHNAGAAVLLLATLLLNRTLRKS
jgi:cytochrome c oxidase assembly protein subunit 15